MRYSINFDSTQIPDEKRARLIKDAGFDSVFLWWDASGNGNFERVETVRKSGLEIETAHTDFHGINAIWCDTIEGERLLDYYIRSVDEAAECGIPTLIIHLSSGNTPPEFNQLGLSRYLAMIAEAEKKNVILAFENLRLTSYLDSMLASSNSPAARFCFDIGHEHIYNGSDGVLESHGDLLAALHIHDNHGSSDEHLLPFDGTIDWRKAASRLKPYLGRLPFTVEAYASDSYDQETFYINAMSAAEKVVALL